MLLWEFILKTEVKHDWLLFIWNNNWYFNRQTFVSTTAYKSGVWVLTNVPYFQAIPFWRCFHFIFFLLKTSYFLCNSRCHVSIPNLREGNNFRLRCVRKKKPNSQQFMNENTFMLISLIKKKPTYLKVFISVFLKN